MQAAEKVPQEKIEALSAGATPASYSSAELYFCDDRYSSPDDLLLCYYCTVVVSPTAV
jgi:hypothetical protein